MGQMEKGAPPTVVWLWLHQSFGWGCLGACALCETIWLCAMTLLPTFFVALEKSPPLGRGSQWGPPSKVGEGIT